MKNGGQKTASVLTYYSLLNLVPLIGVAFGIAKGFGLERFVSQYEKTDLCTGGRGGRVEKI